MSDETVFAEALGIPPGPARAAYLDRVCGVGSPLRREVDELLSAHAENRDFLEQPAVDRDSGEMSFNAPTVEQPDGSGAPAGMPADAAVDYRQILQPSVRPDSLGRIGHYEVLEVLGQGGFGIVFREFDDVLQRVVALKVLSPAIAATSPARKRFLREARASAQVRHENVVQVYSVEEQPLPYLVMEYIPGETLQHRLDRTGPLDVAEIVRLGRQTAEGLAAAHAQGLIHRDIKPANLLIEAGARGRVKITDFGLARAADDASQTQSGFIAGTPLFMAPEQARGGTLDQRADLFSLGSVLYVVATGRPPFRAPTTFAVLKRVVEDTPRPVREIIPELPVWVADVIARLHAKNPDDRFQSAREVADVLADCEAQLQARGEVGNVFLPRRGFAAGRSDRWRFAAVLAVALPLVALTMTEVTGVTRLFSHRAAASRTEPTGPEAPNPDPPAAPTGPVLKKTLRGHTGHLDSVVYSPDGRFLASGGLGAVRVWDARSGALRHALKVEPGHQYNALAFTADGNRLLTAPVTHASAGDITIWNTETGQQDGLMEGHPSGVFEIAVSADGTAFSAGWDGTVRVWDLKDRHEVRSVPVPTGRFVRSVALLPGGVIAVGCGEVYLFRADGTPVRSIEKDAAQLTATRDGRRLAGSIWRAGVVTVWDPETGDEVASWRAHDGAANGVAFSPDGSVLATAGGDGKVRLWDAETRDVLAELSHDGPAYGVAFAPDGKTLATTGPSDRLVKLWDVSGLTAGRKKSKD